MLLAAGLLLGGAASGLAQVDDAQQRAKEIDAFCRTAYCRPPRTVKVNLEDGTTFERNVPRLPIVLPNGWITIFAGEEIHIELTVEQGKVTSARAVPKVDRRKQTITFRLRQQPGSAQTDLTVTSRLPRNLKYNLGVMLPSGGAAISSPSCPVQAGLTAHETWVQPVFQAVIRELRLLAEDAPLSCG